MSKRISLIVQAMHLKADFPNSFIKRSGEVSLLWEGTITPSPLSMPYTVRLEYKRNHKTNLFVLEPRLKLAEGARVLPHTYSTSEQRLCLFHPATGEWNTTMLFTRTIIPWASEWLFHYEIWVGTGNWLGGGVHIDSERDKSSEEINNSDLNENEIKRDFGKGRYIQ